MMKHLKLMNFAALLSAGIFSFSASAWVDLEQWKKPKVFGLGPAADTAQVSINLQGESQKIDAPRMNKTNISLLGLYPILDPLVAGFTVGGSASTLTNIPTSQGMRTMKSSGAYLELAALYAIQDTLSVFLSPGFSSKKTNTDSGESQESFATLTTYGVWAVSDQAGVGVGLTGKKNSRTQSVIPLLGGAWQPTAEFRIDGWLPANVHARWKFSGAQSLFARLELAGESAASDHLTEGEKTDVQLLGAQFLVGWSIGMPIGFGTGFVRIDPSIGLFKGQLSQKSSGTPNESKVTTPARGLADVRLAVAF